MSDQAAPAWAYDFESHLIQPGLGAPPPVCGSSATGQEPGQLHATRVASVQRLREILESGAHVVGCNLPYDLGVAAAVDPVIVDLLFKAGDEDRLHDIAVNEALHDIAIGKLFIDYDTGKSFAKRDEATGEMSGRYSMAILMKRHFGIDISASKKGKDLARYNYARLEGKPVEHWTVEERDYPKRDARQTLDIFFKQRLPGRRNLHDAPRQVRAAVGLQLIHLWGMRTDREYVTQLEAKVDAEWLTAREEFSRAGIFELQPDGRYKKNTKVLQAMVSAAYAGKAPRTKTGISTDRDTLEESGDALLIRLAKSGKNDKRKTQYIPKLKEGFDRPLTPEFNAIVDTGRVSSDFQQLPQKGNIREGIVARGYLKKLSPRNEILFGLPNSVFVSCDYEGLELRTMAQRAIYDKDVRTSKLADMLNAGIDVHTYVAAFFLGVSYESLKARVKAKDPIAIAFRSLAKIFNFGKGGGMGAASMAFNARSKDRVSFCLLANRAKRCGEFKGAYKVRGQWKKVCEVCVQVSKELGEKWLKALPEQGKLFDKASRLTSGGRTVTSIVPWSLRERGDCIYTQWLNNPFQGMGGDGVKLAQWRIQREMYTMRRSPLWGSRLVLNIHDELLAEILEERLHEASYRMAEIMIDSMNEVTPDVKNNVEPAACRRLFKSASTVVDLTKRLKPWWPVHSEKDKETGKELACDPVKGHHVRADCSCWKWQPDQEQMMIDLAA